MVYGISFTYFTLGAFCIISMYQTPPEKYINIQNHSSFQSAQDWDFLMSNMELLIPSTRPMYYFPAFRSSSHNLY